MGKGHDDFDGQPRMIGIRDENSSVLTRVKVRFLNYFRLQKGDEEINFEKD